MIPFLSRILDDYESLREYEESQLVVPCVSAEQILRRLVARERSENPHLSDSYYDGYKQMVIDEEVCKSVTDLMVKLPRQWADEFLIRERNHVYVDAEQFFGWMELISRIPPLWIIAAYHLDRFHIDQLSSPTTVMRMVENMNLIQFQYSAQPVPYIPDLHFFVESEGGLDDLHIHLNGSTETDAVWPHLLTHPHKSVSEFANAYKKNESVRKLSEQVMPGITPRKLLERLSCAKEMKQIMLSIACREIGINSIPSAAKFTSLICEMFFYMLVMKVIERDTNEKLAGMLHHYLLIKGMVHKFLVMQQSQVGFSQFQMMTGNSFREDVERQYENRFKQFAGCADIPFLRVVEGRFSPRLSSFENRLYVKRIVDGFNKAKKSYPKLMQYAELRLVAHFIKKSDNRKGIRHQSLRAEVKRKAWALNAFVNRDFQKYGQKVFGVDAAASEFDARPEVFAAAYRYLRSKGFRHFTFHAGEDFHHLLSGLRTIFEAIDFLDLRSGDRLGHCTAVGISPALWRQRVGEDCYIPSGEWLDDLVFVWAMIGEERNARLQSIVPRLESEISTLSIKVYGSVRHPSELWDALLMRRWCPVPELNNYQMKAVESPTKLRNNLLNEMSSHIGFRLWLAYYQVDEQLIPHRHSQLRDNYDQRMSVKIGNLFSDADFEELQRIILRRMAKRNIVIEALPSSNMHISYYDKLKEYHLSRWLSVDGEECLMPSVVLGTDDPGIFMTNIYNEYAMVYQHLGEHNCSPMKRVEIITNLQKFSEIYRFRQ